MKTKIQSGITAILLLLAVSCSKDNSTTNNGLTPRGNTASDNSTVNRSQSITSSQTSNVSASTMDDAQTDDLSIVGQWILYYDWSCDGNPNASVTTFNANGTWSNDQGYTGIWVKGRHMLVFKFDAGPTTYSGVIFSQEIKGIQSTFQYAGSLQGCFNMVPYTGGLNQDQEHKDGSPDAAGKTK